MKVTDLIGHLALGAFIGCFIVTSVEVLISIQLGPQNIFFTGVDIINAFLGSIVVGWGFSLSGFIYEKEDLALPLQVLFQMVIGFTVLFIMAIYLEWLPIDLGLNAILEWIIIAVIFASIFWIGFYIYYCLLARDINKKLN